MGILDKARTKARTAPVQLRSPLPFEPGGSWRLQNGIAASALIRGAVARIKTQGLNSSALQGRQLALSRALTDQSSSLWYTQEDAAASWLIRLGLRSKKPGEYITDWAIRVACREDAGAVDVTISTPAYRTLDGALVNGKTHDRLRDLLIEAFRGTDDGAASAVETEFGARSMESAVVLDESADLARFAECAIRATVTDEQIVRALRRVSLPLVEVTPTRQIFRLGLNRPDVPRSLGTVAWESPDESGMRTLRLSFALEATGSAFQDAAVARAALGLAKRVRLYLLVEDKALLWEGPDLYSWTW